MTPSAGGPAAGVAAGAGEWDVLGSWLAIKHAITDMICCPRLGLTRGRQRGDFRGIRTAHPQIGLDGFKNRIGIHGSVGYRSHRPSSEFPGIGKSPELIAGNSVCPEETAFIWATFSMCRFSSCDICSM